MSNIPASKKIVQYGLSEVYSSPNPQVDIVFVHGLNGHPHNTWATHKPDTFWPSDLLPSALEEQHIRILTYGYDANVGAFTDGASKEKIHNHAEHLASRLTANRSLKKATERPIIFVCHSLGGLVVKRCLIYANSVRHAHTERLRSIYVSTYGILFLGTPHNGSDLAKWGTLLQSICAAVLPKKFFDTSPQLVEALVSNNETLQNINRLFIEIIGRYRVYFFHESKPMDLKGTRSFVVDEDSAAPVIEGVERMGIERDHSHMCKFEDENAPGYDVVAEAIQRYAEEGPKTISKRWLEEKSIRNVERREAAEELLGDTILQMTDNRSRDNFGERQGGRTARTSQTVSLGSSVQSLKQIEGPPIDRLGAIVDDNNILNGLEPLLIAPLGFRPNSLFFGFQIELDQLHQRLSNQKKRSIGTCAVVLWGPPGSGKTHLAREYLWRHKVDFPSGVFWIDCKSEESIYKSFWEIAQAAALLGVADTTERDRDWDGAKTFLGAVRKWLESREGWLIVFDGVTFDSEDEILAFVKFIPDSKGNSIIFTSVDRTLAKRQRLLYPTAVKVSPLSVDDARSLLYRGLDIQTPNSAQETKATELVKYYEFLPLAIHAMGHVLTSKGKALEKYRIGSYPTSKRLAEPYLEIMQDLRENDHHEAVNLINLLSFYGHSVPVAMLQLGRRALKVEIRSLDREGSRRRDLDTTIAILRKYGLVERTLRSYNVERTDSLKSQPSLVPQGGDSSPETTQDSTREEGPTQRPESSLESSSTRSITCSIDILRVHTVVQGFCRDDLKLRDKEEYWPWLIAAVKLFCRSYAIAAERIRADGPGLVRDYREYETHAANLYSHFPKDKRKASRDVRNSRHELRQVMRAIKEEIETNSPTQSFQIARHQVQISIFERTSSTSSDGPDTPSSTPSRTSTWTIEDLPTKSESPIEIEFGRRVKIYEAVESGEDSWSEGHGYESEFDDSLRSSVVTERRSSVPEVLGAFENTQVPYQRPSSRKSSFLQAIFKGHPMTTKSHKDLGDWRPVPAPPSLTHADIQSPASSKASSGDEHRPISAGSHAEAALAAVHRFSPPASRGGRIRSPSRPTNAETQDQENSRPPLTMKSPNLSLSPLAAEFDPNQIDYLSKSATSSRHHSRNSTTSPPLLQVQPVQTANLVDEELPGLPIEESITITRRIPRFNMRPALPTNAEYYMTQSEVLPTPAPYLPTGYTSQPMSRDASRESNQSLATAPAGPSTTSLSPPTTSSYMYRAAPASTNALAASYPNSSNHLNRIGDWATNPNVSTIVVPLAPAISLDGAEPGVVQFGAASPVNLYDARARADEYAKLLMPFERGDLSRIPKENTRPPASAIGREELSSNGKEADPRASELHGLGLQMR